MREQDSYMRTGWYDQVERNQRIDYRNGFYERDFMTRLGDDPATDCAHTGPELPAERTGEVSAQGGGRATLIGEAFLRGISTRRVGRIVATFTGEPVASFALIVTDGCPGLAAAIQVVYPARPTSTLLGPYDAEHC